MGSYCGNLGRLLPIVKRVVREAVELASQLREFASGRELGGAKSAALHKCMRGLSRNYQAFRIGEGGSITNSLLLME